jgi:heat shock protein HslJ
MTRVAAIGCARGGGRLLGLTFAVVLITACASGSATRNPNLPPITPIMIPPPLPSTGAADLIGPAWHWQRTDATHAADAAVVVAPERYTLEFTGDGRLLVVADCNRGSARYTQNADGRLALTPIAITKMGCPAGSQDALFMRQLADVEHAGRDAGALKLTLRGGTARMHFAR